MIADKESSGFCADHLSHLQTKTTDGENNRELAAIQNEQRRQLLPPNLDTAT